MKTTLGVTRRDAVILPARLRNALGITGDDQVTAVATPDGNLLPPAVAMPIEFDDARSRSGSSRCRKSANAQGGKRGKVGQTTTRIAPRKLAGSR
jgi:bifunctional DNA-binding transcriptional regulator/antitoxin component of YhaV-PrlF toxin-antitoxin module